MIVLDASAAAELLLGTEPGHQVAELIRNPDETIHAPHLLTVEVASVVRRIVASGDVTPADGLRALHELLALGVEFYPHDLLLERIFALRANLTAYDAAYVALAEGLNAVLVTTDAKLAGAPGHRARVRLIG